jgi:DNA polymerase phi
VLIQSEILVRPKTSPEAISKTIENLVTLAMKKPWLREPSSKSLCNLVLKVPQLGKSVAEQIFQQVQEKGLLQSQDGAAILIALNSLSKIFRPKLSTDIWKHANPLHPSNLQLLSKALKEFPSEDGIVKESGNFKSEVHFIWNYILQSYIETQPKIVEFKSLWDTVVESISFHID